MSAADLRANRVGLTLAALADRELAREAFARMYPRPADAALCHAIDYAAHRYTAREAVLHSTWSAIDAGHFPDDEAIAADTGLSAGEVNRHAVALAREGLWICSRVDAKYVEEGPSPGPEELAAATAGERARWAGDMAKLAGPVVPGPSAMAERAMRGSSVTRRNGRRA